MPVVALAYLLVVPASSSQTVYRLNMKEWLQCLFPGPIPWAYSLAPFPGPVPWTAMQMLTDRPHEVAVTSLPV
jgi:hypothetical protein